MRLPTDATLLIGDGADPELERIWREEELPVTALGFDAAELEDLATATVVVAGRGAPEAAAIAARLGFRTFLVDEATAAEGVRSVTLAEALQAGRAARARERWRATRNR
jgi:microcystin degradation protein MlrC